MAMSASLPAFLRRMASERYEWGRFDCGLLLADWWELNHGFDPAATLRGAYSSREECAELVGSGGKLRLIAGLARSAGAPRTHDPQPGDFAVVRLHDMHLGAIRTASGKWAVKGERGMLALSTARVVAAWKI